ncbi:MAG: restriction endonuclease [Micrococcales bacterium]|nr:restriction endonuclease [Micrococcales bacterium]
MLTVQDSERLVTGVWADLATGYGIVADAPDCDADADIVLSGPDLPRTAFEVKRFVRPVQPSMVRRLAAERVRRSASQVGLLLIAPAASPQARRAAQDAGVSLVTAQEGVPAEGALRTAAEVVFLESARSSSVRARARGRVPWGTYAVAFALLERPAADQSELALRAGIGRSRVSQVLTQLGNLVARIDDGWKVRDVRALADWLVERYPPEPLLATTWATLDPPVRAAEVVHHHLDEIGVRHAVSGDVAADQIAPWARPTTAWLWVAAPTDLQPVGLTPAPGDAATVTLAISEDPHLLASARPGVGELRLPLLPGWRVWVDLLHQGRVDAADALGDALVADRDR